MDPILTAAGSGMRARLQSLDMLANNVSNSGTAGFKADREFYNLYRAELPLVESEWTDYSQGTLTETGNPLNLALSGAGFFALNAPNGTVYTRNGSFQVSKANQLAAAEGYTLRNVLDQGKPIQVDPAQPIAIDRSGFVMQNGQQLGQIEVAQPPLASPQALSKLGSTYFALSSPAAMAPAPAAEVLQGQLEQSNVAVSDSAVRLVSVMRQFEMLQKAMTLGAEMNREAIQQVASVSSS